MTNTITVECITYSGGPDARCWLRAPAPGYQGLACSALRWTHHALATLDEGLAGRAPAKRSRR